MTTKDNQRLYLDDLCKRWRKNADEIVEMAIAGKVELWMGFSNVLLWKTGGSKGKKPPKPQMHEQIEVKPQPEVLAQIQGRCDRMMIGAEFSCLDDKNKAVMLSNSVGDEWGETSMLGFKPATLFARLDDVRQFEVKNNILPHTVDHANHEQPQPSPGAMPPGIPKDHPCFAPELHAAGNCWNALFAQTETTTTKITKAEIVAWLREQHPELSKAAMERIALVVTPTKNGRP